MNKSESIKNLALAIVKLQSELTPVLKDAENPYYKSKYATLEAVWGVVGPALVKNNFAVLQVGDDEKIETILMHCSGEWISGSAKLVLLKHDPQAQGSSITYARRYWLSALLGVTVEDDDGNRTVAASPVSPVKTPSTPGTPVQVIKGVDPLNYVMEYGSNKGKRLGSLSRESMEEEVAYWRGPNIKGPLKGKLLNHVEILEQVLNLDPSTMQPMTPPKKWNQSGGTVETPKNNTEPATENFFD